jgi:penicillin-binding protein 1A
MARRRSLLRRSGRLVLDLPETTGSLDSPRHRRWRWLRVTVIALLVMVVAGSATAYGFVTAITTNLPDLRQFDAARAEPPQDGSIWATGLNGQPVRIATLRSAESRVIVRSDQISDAMKNAIVAVEDRRFYRHRGVDLPGIARAIYNRFATGSIEGASTITQQLVKNTYLTNEQTVERKVREASLAWQLEQRWSKDRILTAYLNTVYFGHNTYGVESASRFYFGKSARDLDPADAALLAAIPKSPTAFDPLANPDAALARRNLVLRQMGEQGLLDADAVLVEQGRRLLPVTRIDPKPIRSPEPYWAQFITEQLVNRFGTGRTFGGGMRVFTSLDLREQKLAREALRSTLPTGRPQGSLVVIEPGTGQVKAMVGGKPYSQEHQFNVPVNARRQPGSAFKPFVYLAALGQGIQPATTFESRRVLYDLGGGQIWFVKNNEEAYGEYLNLDDALAYSDNTIYAQLTMLVKPAAVAETAHALGITTPIDEGQPAIGLGGLYIGVSPLQLAQAYATIANDGRRIGGSLLFRTPDSGISDPTYDPVAIVRIEFPDGSEVVNAPQAVQAIPENHARLVTQAMQGTIAVGTGKEAQIGRPAAGKTGTTTDYKDAWFVGFTPDRVASVWVGFENPALPMRTQNDGDPVTGGSLPARAWKAFMEPALEDIPAAGFTPPDYVPQTTIALDRRTGQRVPGDCEYAQYVVMADAVIPASVDACPTNLLPVPDFLNATRRGADRLATGSGLQLRYAFRPVEPGEKAGTVVDQSPQPLDALPAGGTVTLVIGRQVPRVVVPPVIASEGEPIDAAAAITRLETLGFRVVVEDGSPTLGLPIGSVTDQIPSAGKPAPEGSIVVVAVSGLYDGARVPDIQGATLEDAERLLADAGLVGVPINVGGDLRPLDRVFSVDPSPGSEVPPGTEITLFVSPIS